MDGRSSGNLAAGESGAADDRWEDMPGSSKARPRKRRVFTSRKPLSKKGKTDSTPMMVADFVFRKQIEWMVENTGVRDDFKDVALKIWFSYLSHYVPDLQDGLERELGGNQYWHHAFPQGDLTALLDCSKHELAVTLENLRRRRRMDGGESGRAPKSSRLAKDFSLLTVKGVANNLRLFRPTSVVLIAVIGIALHVCQEEVVVSDLLRWVRLLKLPLVDLLPYRDGASPAELRGVSEKSRALYGAAQYAMVERVLVWLASVMLNEKINALPGLPVAPFVERFIQELNLPNEMIPYVLGLLDSMRSAEYRIESMSTYRAPKAPSRRCLNMEGHLMCCIFYALRILFVLDDATENSISDRTERMVTLEPSFNLFNFRVWYQHLMQRRVALFKHTMLTRQVHSVTAYPDFVQSNLVPVSVSSAKKLASDNTNRKRKKLLQQLQLGWRRSNTSDFSVRSIDLSMTVRPYRAHTEALVEHYPHLAVDFGQQTIKHLLEDTSWLEGSAQQSALDAEVSVIQSTRKEGFRHTQPFRLVRTRVSADRKKQVEKENTSLITQDLVRTMAEMIEQQPGQLFGYLTFLEMIFFPKHPNCSNMGNACNLKKLQV